MRVPMPSPFGSNHARLFVDQPRDGGAAYDAKLEESAAAALSAFLQDKLTAEDFAEFCRLAGIDAGLSMDQKRNRFRMALDGRLGEEMRRLAVSGQYSVAARIQMFGPAPALNPGFAKRYPHAAKIRTSH